MPAMMPTVPAEPAACCPLLKVLPADGAHECEQEHADGHGHEPSEERRAPVEAAELVPRPWPAVLRVAARLGVLGLSGSPLWPPVVAVGFLCGERR